MRINKKVDQELKAGENWSVFGGGYEKFEMSRTDDFRI